MKQLIHCTGLNPGSIYAAFGDKKALFNRTMDFYTDLIREKHCELEKNKSPREFIIAVFDEMISSIQAKRKHDGCFMVNTALDIAPQDKKIQQFVSQWFEEVEGFFRQHIVEAQKIGEISNNVDPEKAARHIMSLMCGAQVLARVTPEHPSIGDLKEQIENILK